MASAQDSSTFSSLGSACVLLQVQLGLGLFLGAVGVFAASSPELRKHIDVANWESTLRATAKAASPALLLTIFALIQAQAASPDILTSTGLLVAGAAVTLSAFVAALGPIRASADTEDAAEPRFLTFSRVLNSIQAFGSLLLIFGAPPAGAQLLCASAFTRLALAAQALRALSRALILGAGPVSKVLRDVEPVLALAPLLGGLALLDAMAWGPSGIMSLPLQPVVYCASLVVIVAFARLSLGAGVESFGSSDLAFTFQLEGAIGSTIEAVRAANVLAILAAMLLSLGSVLLGTFTIEVSTSGFSVQWGDLLVSAAAKLGGLLVAARVAGFVYSHFFPTEEVHTEEVDEVLPINGMEVSGTTSPVQLKDLTMMDFAKAALSPAQTLLLGLIAARLKMPEGQSGAMTVATLPFSYGFVLATCGVMMQVALLVLYGAVHADESHSAEPTFDATGTVQWKVKAQMLSQFVEGFRFVTFVCLEGGLLLGCLGLGPLPLVAGGLSAFAALYIAAPSDARQTANTVLKVCTCSLGSGIETILEKQRQAQEASAARKAAAVAQALEAESAPKKAASQGAGGGAKKGAPAQKDGARKRK